MGNWPSDHLFACSLSEWLGGITTLMMGKYKVIWWIRIIGNLEWLLYAHKYILINYSFSNQSITNRIFGSVSLVWLLLLNYSFLNQSITNSIFSLALVFMQSFPLKISGATGFQLRKLKKQVCLIRSSVVVVSILTVYLHFVGHVRNGSLSSEEDSLNSEVSVNQLMVNEGKWEN